MGAHTLPAAGHEQEVVASCQDRSDGAFDLLYRNYAPPLREFCKGRLDDATEAEDACHEALLKAYAAFPRFNAQRRLWPWLATIAARVCIDMQRTHRTVALDDDSADELQREVAEAPDLEVDRRLCRQLVGEAIADMPDRYRAPVYLREMEEWSYKEIAALEMTTVAAVRSALVRGRKLLRVRVQEMADTNRLWPMPAFAPFAGLRPAWDRMTARLATLRSNTVGEASLPLAGAIPNAVQAFLVIIVAGAGIAFLPAGGGDTEPAGSTSVAASGSDSATIAAITTGPDADGAADQLSLATSAAPHSPAPDRTPMLEVELSETTADATIEEDTSGRTLEGTVTSRVPADADAELFFRIDCQRTQTHRTACDTSEEALQSVPGDEADDTSGE